MLNSFLQKSTARLCLLHLYLKKLPPLKFILVILLLSYILTIVIVPFDLIADHFYPSKNKPVFYSLDLPHQLFLACVFAPLIETLISQKLMITALQWIPFFNKRALLVILISGIIFSLGHYYSVSYIITILPTGILLPYAYVIYEKKKFSAYWMVAIIHALKNLIAVGLTFYFVI